jgi:hypothetical protein
MFWIIAKQISVLDHPLESGHLFTLGDIVQMSCQKALSVSSQLLICIQNHLLR